MEQYVLSEQDILFCRKAIEQLDDDGNGLIGIYDFQTVLERMEIHYQENELCKLISDLDVQNKGLIQFQDVLRIYQKKRQAQVYGEDDQDTLDAYVAIGGPSDKSGHIDGDVLVRIIKEEFDLPIDIEQLIREVDDSGNGEIQYEQFQKMLREKGPSVMK